MIEVNKLIGNSIEINTSSGSSGHAETRVKYTEESGITPRE